MITVLGEIQAQEVKTSWIVDDVLCSPRPYHKSKSVLHQNCKKLLVQSSGKLIFFLFVSIKSGFSRKVLDEYKHNRIAFCSVQSKYKSGGKCRNFMLLFAFLQSENHTQVSKLLNHLWRLLKHGEKNHKS